MSNPIPPRKKIPHQTKKEFKPFEPMTKFTEGVPLPRPKDESERVGPIPPQTPKPTVGERIKHWVDSTHNANQQKMNDFFSRSARRKEKGK